MKDVPIARFTINEVDTKGKEVFDLLASASTKNIERCGDLAKVIFEYSKSEQIRQHLKRRFLDLLIDKYPFLTIEDVEFGSQKLISLYCNRAFKKLDISSDVEVFSEIATRYVKEGVTLLHYDRLYTLYQAVRNVIPCRGDIIELGVYRGGSLKFIREVLDRLAGKQSLYGFDTFVGHTVITEHDGNVHRENMFDGCGGIEGVRAYINDPRVQLIAGNVSETIRQYVEKCEAICLAHFDMDVYQPTADALPLVYEKLSPNGIVIFDDYGFTSCPGVKRAVDDFLAVTPAVHFHLMTGQLILWKKSS